jgi:predicted DNA-binding transcriptional regulator AlpA
MSKSRGYMKRSTLAGYLDVVPSTVDDLVKRGVLPEPYRLSPGVVRWFRDEVDAAIKSLRGDASPAERDPYLAGVAHVGINKSDEKQEDDDVP